MFLIQIMMKNIYRNVVFLVTHLLQNVAISHQQRQGTGFGIVPVDFRLTYKLRQHRERQALVTYLGPMTSPMTSEIHAETC